MRTHARERIRIRSEVEDDVKNPRDTNSSSSSSSSFDCACADSSSSLRAQQLAFYERLIRVIRPMSQSDRTSFQRISAWVVHKCSCGEFNEHEAFPRVLES
jgi:hypothetical protein